MQSQDKREASRLRLKDLPPDARPRERLLELGPKGLADAELLAILLGSGSASETALDLALRLLATFGATGPEALRGLSSARPEELARLHGLGPAKASRLVAAFELAERAGTLRATERPAVGGPEDLVRLVSPHLRGEAREHALVVWLNGRQQVLGWEAVSVGSLTEAVVHPREVYREAIRRGACAIALLHNHPSGDPAPSEEDRALTRRLVAVGGLVGIPLIDHVIVAEGGYYSLRAERGLWEGTDAGGAGVGATL
ncbi:MAG TPA: DNA repair protein RadC [Pantanalinema sp.]